MPTLLVQARPVSVALTAAVLVIACAGGCTDGSRPIDPRHEIVLEYVPVPLDNVVNAATGTCATGDTLLGAGYRVDRATLDLHNAVAVRENHPTDDGSWVVTVVRRPDVESSEAVFSLYLYCLHRSDGASPVVTSHVRTGSPVALPVTQSGIGSATTTVACPTSRTLTSGGFTIDLGVDDPSNTAATYNSWITGSLPGDHPGEWEVEGSFIQIGGIRPSIQPYALCVDDPTGVLDPQPVDDVAAEREGGFNFDFFSGTAPCPDRGFTTGGGSRFAGDPLVPRSITKNQHLIAFTGWDVRGVYGHQPGDTAELTARPLCFRRVDLATPDQVDLVPLIGDKPLSRAGCPGDDNPCLTFTIVNAGTATSPETSADVFVPGATPVRSPVPALEAGETVELSTNILDPCADNCSATVTVDRDGLVVETDETNNTAEWFVVG